MKRVPMRTNDLTPELQHLLEKSMPSVWNSLKTSSTSPAPELRKQKAL